MAATRKIVPQVPGVLPEVEPDSLAPLLRLSIVDLVAGLPVLTDLELVGLLDLEAQGEQRAAVVGIVETEQWRRLEDAEAPKPVAASAPNPEKSSLGELHRFAGMHARDVDMTGQTRPILTLDGWLLPMPRAEG